AKSENPNDSLPTENLLLWIDLFRLTSSERYLSSNNVVDLHVGVFSNLTNLQDLYLSSNNIVDLHVGVFSNLINLEEL
ncbi:unnamed protein product, partial [Porites lobata]